MGDGKQICRLCLEIVPPGEGEFIEDIKKERLDVLLINIDLHICDNAVACNKCLRELQDCFHFKSTSRSYFDGHITNFVQADDTDIKNGFQTEMDGTTHVNVENILTCRLCMSFIDVKASNYNKDLKDMLRNCLPEVDITVDEPLICDLCLNSMNKLNKFMKTCQEVERSIRTYRLMVADHDTPAKDILHEVLKFKQYDPISKPIKEEYLGDDSPTIKFEEVHIKDELNYEQSRSNDKKMYKCHCCTYESKRKTNLNRHISVVHQRKSVTNGELFRCQYCSYESKVKCNLNRHILALHEMEHATNNGKILKCNYCNYKSIYKTKIDAHISVIHERETAIVYNCKECSFETLHSNNLRRHVKMHGSMKKLAYKCPECKRGFSRKNTLEDHLLKNHDNFQHLITSKIHHCEFCTYKSINATHLTTHIAHRHDPQGAEKFRCHHCQYVTLRKFNLAQHVLVHSNLRPHLCTSCKKGFNAKYRLDSHILSYHKDNADLLKTITKQVHECTMCRFQTVFKTKLSKHIKMMHE